MDEEKRKSRSHSRESRRSDRSSKEKKEKRKASKRKRESGGPPSPVEGRTPPGTPPPLEAEIPPSGVVGEIRPEDIPLPEERTPPPKKRKEKTPTPRTTPEKEEEYVPGPSSLSDEDKAAWEAFLAKRKAKSAKKEERKEESPEIMEIDTPKEKTPSLEDTPVKDEDESKPEDGGTPRRTRRSPIPKREKDSPGDDEEDDEESDEDEEDSDDEDDKEKEESSSSSEKSSSEDEEEESDDAEEGKEDEVPLPPPAVEKPLKTKLLEFEELPPRRESPRIKKGKKEASPKKASPKKEKGKSPPKARSPSPAEELDYEPDSDVEEPEEPAVEASAEARSGEIFEQAIFLLGAVTPSPKRALLNPTQAAWRMNALGPKPESSEEYVFSLGPVYQFAWAANRLPDIDKSFKGTKKADKPGKIRKYGKGWPIPLRPEQSSVPPGIPDTMTMGELGARDIEVTGWVELYRAAEAQYNEELRLKMGGVPFKDVEIRLAYRDILRPKMRLYSEDVSIRTEFHAKRAALRKTPFVSPSAPRPVPPPGTHHGGAIKCFGMTYKGAPRAGEGSSGAGPSGAGPSGAGPSGAGPSGYKGKPKGRKAGKGKGKSGPTVRKPTRPSLPFGKKTVEAPVKPSESVLRTLREEGHDVKDLGKQMAKVSVTQLKEALAGIKIPKKGGPESSPPVAAHAAVKDRDHPGRAGPSSSWPPSDGDPPMTFTRYGGSTIKVTTDHKGNRETRMGKVVEPAATVFHAVLKVHSGPGPAMDIKMSYNKPLTPLGLRRASQLSDGIVTTFARHNGRICVTMYDSTAPVYFGIDEVAAALSKQGGPPIELKANDNPFAGGEEP